jgi:hypothetical protein
MVLRIWFLMHSDGVVDLILDTFRWCWGFENYKVSTLFPNLEKCHMFRFIFCSSLFSNTIIFYFWVCSLRCIVLVYYLLRSYLTL